MTCQLENIVAIYLLPVRHEVNHRGEAIARLGADEATFDHYKCDKHDCTFRQWRAVLSHIGQTEVLATHGHDAAPKNFYGEGMIGQAGKEIDLDTALVTIIHKATRAYNGADIPPLVAEIRQALSGAGYATVHKHIYRDEDGKEYIQYTLQYPDGSGEFARVPRAEGIDT